MFNAYSICWHITYVLKLCSAVAVAVCLFVDVAVCMFVVAVFVCLCVCFFASIFHLCIGHVVILASTIN